MKRKGTACTGTVKRKKKGKRGQSGGTFQEDEIVKEVNEENPLAIETPTPSPGPMPEPTVLPVAQVKGIFDGMKEDVKEGLDGVKKKLTFGGGKRRRKSRGSRKTKGRKSRRGSRKSRRGSRKSRRKRNRK